MKYNKLLIMISFLIFISILMNNNSINMAESKEIRNKLTTNPYSLNELISFAFYAKNIFVVWNSWPNELNSEIYFCNSSNNGITWSNPKQISITSFIAVSPKILEHNNNLFLIWKQYNNSIPELFFSKSQDNGLTWMKPSQITYNNSIGNNIYDLNFCLINNHLVLVWKDYRFGSSEIVMKFSKNFGEDWSEIIRLTKDNNPSYSPKAYVNNGLLYVIYEDWVRIIDMKIIRINFNKNYNIESLKIRKTNNESNAKEPDIYVHDDKLMITWQDDRHDNLSIYAKISLDGGNSWEEDILISDLDKESINPQFYGNSEKVFIYWQQIYNDTSKIFHRKTIDFGEYWTNIENINDTRDCYDVIIDGVKNNFHIFWKEYIQSDYSEIHHIGFLINSPLIYDTNISSDIITTNNYSLIKIQGYSNTFSNYKLNCIVEYKNRSDSWNHLDVEYDGYCWFSYFNINNFMRSGIYPIRTRLIDPNGNESELINIGSIQIINDNMSALKNHDLTFFIISIPIIIIVLLVKKRC